MVMTPSRVLRNQMVNEDKLKQSFRLYETKLERINSKGTRLSGIFPYNMADSPQIEKMVDSELVATTTSMVSRNLATIVHWIDHLKSRYGVYPVIFVDEAHTASNQTA